MKVCKIRRSSPVRGSARSGVEVPGKQHAAVGCSPVGLPGDDIKGVFREAGIVGRVFWRYITKTQVEILRKADGGLDPNP